MHLTVLVVFSLLVDSCLFFFFFLLRICLAFLSFAYYVCAVRRPLNSDNVSPHSASSLTVLSSRGADELQ